MLYYRKPFRDDYDYWVEQRNALIQIKKRKKHLIDTGFRISSSNRDPKVRELRNALEDEDDGLMGSVDKVLDE